MHLQAVAQSRHCPPPLFIADLQAQAEHAGDGDIALFVHLEGGVNQRFQLGVAAFHPLVEALVNQSFGGQQTFVRHQSVLHGQLYTVRTIEAEQADMPEFAEGLPVPPDAGRLNVQGRALIDAPVAELKKGETADNLLDRLSAVYPEMDDTALQNELARLIFLSGLVGRIEAAQEMGK
ncbi:hypothetical protein AABM17_2226 [Neisseria musculi]|uniref:Uncharacterized protein n=2 Tax=Neisseria musculi TaxID=1815583 RepID=A0A7H1M9Y2_9NEIS|nr:hypothetical protein H7A79_2225 [Neisseria musculi]